MESFHTRRVFDDASNHFKPDNKAKESESRHIVGLEEYLLARLW